MDRISLDIIPEKLDDIFSNSLPEEPRKELQQDGVNAGYTFAVTESPDGISEDVPI